MGAHIGMLSLSVMFTVAGSGEKGDKADYWSYEKFIDAGYTDGMVDVVDYCK